MALHLVLAAGACTRPQPRADNLLFVSFDTVRADHLSAYGYAQPTTPVLERLAARGVLFERAFSHVPSTLPAHTSMFTGLLPPRHGVRCNGKFRLDERSTTLAEILRDAGFVTGAVLGAFPLDARFGVAQGFMSYDADFTGSAVTARRRKRRMDDPGFWIGHDYLDFERSAEEVADRAIAWLEGRRGNGARWFLFAHFFDAHWPYEPDATEAARFASAYDAEIAASDRQLGRVLEVVESLPGRTLIVFTADHGEGLGEHGEMLHNRFVYNSTLHVPLIVALDGAARPGHRVRANVGHVDLLPTILDLLAVAQPSALDGRSLVVALAGGREPQAMPHYSETLVWSLERPHGIEVYSILEGDFKLVHTRTETDVGAGEHLELYDIDFDPRELTDLSLADAGRASVMLDRLRKWRGRLEEGTTSAAKFEMDEGTRQRLRSLGYL